MGSGGSVHGGVSLLHGWLPIIIQVLAGLCVAASLLPWRRAGRRWWVVLAVAALVAGLAVAGGQWLMRDQGLASDHPPAALWGWLGLTGAAITAAAARWRRNGWPIRTGATVAAVLAAVCVGVQANVWIGYFPTVTEAWGQLTAGPLPDQIQPEQLAGLRGVPTTTGKLIAVNTPDVISHFSHRTEYVYLPPAWFDTPHPTLPALMMIGGEFATPTDWIRIGDAVTTADQYAQTHQGFAPILVFADSTGSFRNDTECVDGPRGNSATHLTQELRPYVITQFGAAVTARGWGVVGWSTGGTCAVDIGVTRPDLFGTFEDIQGDLSPNAGDTAKTLANLYGGNAQAMASFDTTTVLTHHTRYPDSAGWFDNAPFPAARHASRPTPIADQDPRAGYGGRPDPAPASMQGQQAAEAATLCTEARADGISCTLHTQPGRHTWQFAGQAFSDALPWLTQRLSATTGTNSQAAPGASVALTTRSSTTDRLVGSALPPRGAGVSAFSNPRAREDRPT